MDHQGDPPDRTQHHPARSCVGWLRRAWTRLTGHPPPTEGAGHSPARPTGGPPPAGSRLPELVGLPQDDCLGDVAALSVRTRAWLAEATRQGWNVGAAPYGYRLHTIVFLDAHGQERRRSRLVAEPVETEVVRQIF